MATSAIVSPRFERQASLERLLLRIRWFGVAFGAFQVATTQSISGEPTPSWLRPAGFALVAALALGNAVLHLLFRSTRGERRLRRIGLAAFSLDVAFLYGMTFLFSFERFGMTWVILYILSVEGAMRWQMRGALAPIAIAFVVEPLREAYRIAAFDHPLVPSSVTFRLGVWLVIAFAAGGLAQRLEGEREQAESLAEREATALSELHALHQVLLAGVSVQDLREALQSMVERINTGLGYGSLTVLLTEDDGRLHPIAAHGLPPHALELSVAVGEGIAGSVAQTGKAEVVPDVRRDPRYFQVDASTASEAAVPILVGPTVVGVLSAERPALDGFDARDLARLERLAAYMALVVTNARLLTQERATVERLRELDTMKSDFVAITSHELRTPLTAMRGFIKTLRRPDLTVTPEELAEFLGILDRQSDRLARLVEDLLIVSRIDAGALHLQMEAVDVAEVLSEMLYELGGRSSRVRLVVDQDLPRVVTDGQRLGQIARNLVENALKFSPATSDVRLTAVRDQESLVIEVTDRGPGIPEEHLPLIFDRFHQVGGSLRRRSDGFGLGLYITKRLVEALGGSVEVESAQGRGTTFRVRLPLATADESSAPASA